MFKDKVEIDTDQRIMDLLIAGRERARGIVNDADEEEPEEAEAEESKPRLHK